MVLFQGVVPKIHLVQVENPVKPYPITHTTPNLPKSSLAVPHFGEYRVISPK